MNIHTKTLTAKVRSLEGYLELERKGARLILDFSLA